MSRRQPTRAQQTHPAEVVRAYERVLAGTSIRSGYVEVGAGNRVHLLEKGAGPPVVLLHGGGNSAGFFRPLLNELDELRTLTPDLPGVGLSDPIGLPPHRYRRAAVAWVDRLLDTLELDATTLLGHSGGAMWALWYALVHPGRVDRLVLIAPPAVPNTSLALPIRLAATPGVGELLARLVPPGPESVLQFAHHAAREQATLACHPDLVDLMVAIGRDPIANRATTAEIRAHVSPFALLSPSGGARRRSRVRPDELRRLATPTLLIWGEHDPLGGASVARAVTELIPDARLTILPTGHGPWLGQPVQTASAVADFVR